MQIIEIVTLENGAHNNQTYHGVIPEGWAIIPDELETPNFPFGEAEAEEIDGVMTVTKWVAGVMPEPAPIVGTQCCGTCRSVQGEDNLYCTKRPPEMGKLWVDAFYVCPLWRAKQRGRYV